jgi:hypothetical protein
MIRLPGQAFLPLVKLRLRYAFRQNLLLQPKLNWRLEATSGTWSEKPFSWLLLEKLSKQPLVN